MREEPRQITMCCPRCGRPIVWPVTVFDGGEQLEVTAWACHCALSDDEWADLGGAAAEALGDWPAPGTLPERGVRRVVEENPG